MTNNSSAWDWAPFFPPDGSKIVFNSYAPDPCFGVKTDILIMDADGSNQQNLTNNQPLISDWRPFFSPDGSKIVFTSNRGVTSTVCNTDEIFIMNTDGTGMQNLTNREPNEYGWAPSAYRPRFFPCGSRIAFLSNRGAAYSDIFSMDLNHPHILQNHTNRDFNEHIGWFWIEDQTCSTGCF